MKALQMKNLIFYTLLMIPIPGHSQTKAIFNKMHFDYKGEVESVFIESFEPIRQNGEIIDFRYEGGLLGIGSQKIFFDDEGKVSMKYEYKTACGGDSITVDKIWKYYYTNSRLDSVTRSEADTSLISRGSRPWKFIYKYESDSVLYEINKLSFLEKMIKTTKTKNKRIKEYLSKDSIVTSTEISTYDKQQRRVKIESWKDGELKSLSILNYGDDNTKMPKIIYKIDLVKNSVRRKEHEYNEHGDLVKTTLYKPNGAYRTHWSFIYEYDEKGNWIKKERYNYEEKMLNIYKQSIKYKADP